jgi:hypothetical protein
MTGELWLKCSGQSRTMVEQSHPADSATYEIRVEGEIPAAVREQFPEISIHHSPTETVLYRDITDLAELDLLLEKLQSTGLVLLEIREVPPSTGGDPGDLSRRAR